VLSTAIVARYIANSLFCYVISAAVVRIHYTYIRIIQPVDRDYKRTVYDYMYTFNEFAVVIASAVGRHCFSRVYIYIFNASREALRQCPTVRRSLKHCSQTKRHTCTHIPFYKIHNEYLYMLFIYIYIYINIKHTYEESI